MFLSPRTGAAGAVRSLPIRLGAVAVLVATMSGEASSAALSAFGYRYGCTVYFRLAEIRDNPSTTDRFIVLSEKAYPQHYVQCLFLDDERGVLCEASSGFYSAPDGEPPRYVPTSSTRAAVARLGYSLGASDGNFQQFRKLIEDEDLMGVAGLMVDTLHEAYGIDQPDTKVKVTAPLGGWSGYGIVDCDKLFRGLKSQP